MTENVDASKREESLQVGRRAARGSLIEMVTFVVSYGLRFVSSMALRGLLFPAAFGVMEVVTGVNVGLAMLTDVGIREAAIRSERGEEQVFLDTAWTMHVVRGVALWLVTVVLAYPAALLSNEPSLVYVLPIASLSTLILGFVSTADLTLRRRMRIGKINALELGCQFVSLITTVTCAYIYASVWALVAGGLVSGVFRLVLTHRLARYLGYRNRFAWDSTVRKEIFDFGKWITGSSGAHFLSNWGDRLLLVSLAGASVAGVYATAMLFAEAVASAAHTILHGVFYPVFAHFSHQGVERLRAVYYRTRLRFDALTMGSTGALSMAGPWVIHVLFDERYAAAGWMLQILAFRSAIMCVSTPCDTCLTSMGLSRYSFYQNLLRAFCVLAGVPLGHALGGVGGVAWAAALSGVPPLLVLWRAAHVNGLLRIEREALAWVFFAAGAGAGWVALYLLPEATAVRHFLRALLASG